MPQIVGAHTAQHTSVIIMAVSGIVLRLPPLHIENFGLTTSTAYWTSPFSVPVLIGTTGITRTFGPTI